MTHKEAIKIITNTIKKTYEFSDKLNIDDIKLSEVRTLLKNNMWHEYSKEKPNEERFYLVKTKSLHGGFNRTHYVISHFTTYKGFNAFDVIDEDVVAWREIPIYEEEKNG